VAKFVFFQRFDCPLTPACAWA